MFPGLVLVVLSSFCLGANIEKKGNEQITSTHSNLNLLLTVPNGEHGHLKWLLNQHEGRKSEIEKARASFIEGLLDAPLAENGKEGSKPKSFLEELLSEPLFENELTKAVINSQKVPQKVVNIPVPPASTTDKLQNEINIVDLVVDSLEIVKDTRNVRKTKSHPNKVFGPKDQLSKLKKGNDLNLLQNIPKNNFRVDKAIGTLTAENIKDFKDERESNDLVQPIDSRKNLLKKTQGSDLPPQNFMDKKATNDAPILSAPTLAPYAKEITHKESVTKKRFLHHLVYIFPSKMKIKPTKLYKAEKHSQRFLSSSHEKKGMNKQISYVFPRNLKSTTIKPHKENHQSKRKVWSKKKEEDKSKQNPSRVQISDTLKKFFLPQSQLETYVSSDNFRYGTLFPVYNYNVYKYRPWIYVSTAFDDQTVFPHFNIQHVSQPLNRKQVNSY